MIKNFSFTLTILILGFNAFSETSNNRPFLGLSAGADFSTLKLKNVEGIRVEGIGSVNGGDQYIQGDIIRKKSSKAIPSLTLNLGLTNSFQASYVDFYFIGSYVRGEGTIGRLTEVSDALQNFAVNGSENISIVHKPQSAFGLGLRYGQSIYERTDLLVGLGVTYSQSQITIKGSYIDNANGFGPDILRSFSKKARFNHFVFTPELTLRRWVGEKTSIDGTLGYKFGLRERINDSLFSEKLKFKTRGVRVKIGVNIKL